MSKVYKYKCTNTSCGLIVRLGKQAIELGKDKVCTCGSKLKVWKAYIPGKRRKLSSKRSRHK